MKRKYIRLGLLVCGILIVTTISLYIVNMPAMFDCMALSNNSSANIGSAIGGISAFIVGVANVVMLYLTFNIQRETLQSQKEEMTKYAEMQKELMEKLFIDNRIENIRSTWAGLISMETNDNSKKRVDESLLFNLKVFLFTLEVIDNKVHLSEMRSIFDTHINHFYISHNDNRRFMEEYRAIEKMFRNIENKLGKKRF